MKNVIITFGIWFGLERVFLDIVGVDQHSLAFQCFKDAAHLFMGGLIVSWWYEKIPFYINKDTRLSFLVWWSAQPYQWNLFWALNVIEVVVATLTRLK